MWLAILFFVVVGLTFLAAMELSKLNDYVRVSKKELEEYVTTFYDRLKEAEARIELLEKSHLNHAGQLKTLAHMPDKLLAISIDHTDTAIRVGDEAERLDGIAAEVGVLLGERSSRLTKKSKKSSKRK